MKYRNRESKKKGEKLNIALLSDFFYPKLGGVEMHQICLGYCLMELGHKVIVITKSYQERKGIRYLPNGMKCYYIPVQDAFDTEIAVITMFPAEFLPVIRNILIRERIDLVHSHQNSGPLCISFSFLNEALRY